jgi:hypothetical protein
LFKGTYVFKENGVEVGRSQNLITTNGRKAILQYLAGTENDWAVDLSIGAMQSIPNVNDVELIFETGRYPITMKTYQSATDTTPDLIVVRATLPSSLYANIYEVAIYPTGATSEAAKNDNRIIADFSDMSGWLTSAGYTELIGFIPQAEQSPRIGNYSIQLSPSTTLANSTLAVDISNYTNLDQLQILADNTVAGNLTVTMTDSAGYQAIFTYTLSDSTDYQVLSLPFPLTIKDPSGNVVSTSSQYLGPIKTIQFNTDSTASIVIDCLKISTTQGLSTSDYIVSKSSLLTPIAKTYGVALDVEYYIELN